MTDYQTIQNSPRAMSRMVTWFGPAPNTVPAMSANRCRKGVKAAKKHKLAGELRFWQEQLALAVAREKQAPGASS